MDDGEHFSAWTDPTSLVSINIGVNKLDRKAKTKTTEFVSDITMHDRPQDYFPSINIPKDFYEKHLKENFTSDKFEIPTG